MTKPPLHLTVDKTPCKSCPYRKDVPSGVWSREEYEKLPVYDPTTIAPGLDLKRETVLGDWFHKAT